MRKHGLDGLCRRAVRNLKSQICGRVELNFNLSERHWPSDGRLITYPMFLDLKDTQAMIIIHLPIHMLYITEQ